MVHMPTHIAPIEDSDQTAQMRSLIRVFDVRICQFVPFAGHWFINVMGISCLSAFRQVQRKQCAQHLSSFENLMRLKNIKSAVMLQIKV